MKHLDKNKKHAQHYFVVDKSNTFSICAICGSRIERKSGLYNKYQKRYHTT